MSASAPGQTVFSIGYDFHLGNGNNGNVYGITNYKDANRNQTFTYDALNRLIHAENTGIDCSAKVLQNKSEYWGNSYSYDAWGNLLQKNVTKCGAENLQVSADSHNWLHTVSGLDYLYDAAGNMTSDPTDGVTLAYDQENRITGVAGYAYTYDADGNRVKKSNGAAGTLYWYMTPGIVAESDLNGNTQSEYVFFNGERVARRDGVNGAGGVFYYFSDHLKTASVITDSAGNIKAESDYYPWGGELQFVNADSNHYKFTGKERDSETGLDYFGARYYSNGLGRWVSADWSATPVPVPYADFGDPQSLNLYTYVRNLPTAKFDIDGHDGFWDFVKGVANAMSSNATWGIGRQDGGSRSFRLGQALGDGISLAGSAIETAFGATVAVGGTALCATGVGCLAGAPAVAAGSTIAVHGVGMGASALTNIHKSHNNSGKSGGSNTEGSTSQQTGSYTNTHESGKTYSGKGGRARSQDSAQSVEKQAGDKHTATDWTQSANDREAFKDESRRLDANGGAKSTSNYNKIDSPGKKYRKQDGSH